MIRRDQRGRYYCDGRYCGYPLHWSEGDPEEGAGGEWVCLDCGAAMLAGKPDKAVTE